MRGNINPTRRKIEFPILSNASGASASSGTDENKEKTLE